MTIDEAIKNLEVIKSVVEWEHPMDWQISLDMAIDALKKNPPIKCKNCKYIKTGESSKMWCTRFTVAMEVKNNDYCSFGESLI